MQPFYRIQAFSYPSMRLIRSINLQTIRQAVWQAKHAEFKGFSTICAIMPADHPDATRLHNELSLALTGNAVPNDVDVVIASGKGS